MTKKILIILLAIFSLNIFASEELLKVSNGLEAAKKSIDIGMGINAQTELKYLKTQAMNMREDVLSDYQKSLKLQYIYEIDQLLTQTFETVSRCEYIFKQSNEKLDALNLSDSRKFIDNWKTVKLIEYKIGENSKCKLMRVLRERIDQTKAKIYKI
ncbi:hypothetical protein M900_1903 [Bacteriovorax sp. Seq25_V]|nr:hypothetical protein M900_1903 [Bacteriovorax sp. Seq25_V]